MLIFDIGANIGRYAIANQNDATVISIEASPLTYKNLFENVKSYKNIIPLHYAVSDSSNTTITFHHCKEADTLSTLNKEWITSPDSRFETYGVGSIEYEVPTISLDKLIGIYGIPDLLKVDVEGAEHIVLKSLTQKVPLLCFEWAAEWRVYNLECIDYLYSLGYTKFSLQMEDNYSYRPTSFDISYEEIKEKITFMRNKIDWGMIWVSI